MGSSIGRIYDDMDDYKNLCKKYFEEYVDVYSDHHNWLELKEKTNTDISFSDYVKMKKKEKLIDEITKAEKYIKELKEELENISKQ